MNFQRNDVIFMETAYGLYVGVVVRQEKKHPLFPDRVFYGVFVEGFGELKGVCGTKLSKCDAVLPVLFCKTPDGKLFDVDYAYCRNLSMGICPKLEDGSFLAKARWHAQVLANDMRNWGVKREYWVGIPVGTTVQWEVY